MILLEIHLFLPCEAVSAFFFFFLVFLSLFFFFFVPYFPFNRSVVTELSSFFSSHSQKQPQSSPSLPDNKDVRL